MIRSNTLRAALPASVVAIDDAFTLETGPGDDVFYEIGGTTIAGTTTVKLSGTNTTTVGP